MTLNYLQVLQGTAMNAISKNFPAFIIILTVILLTIGDGNDAKRQKRLYGGVKATPGQQKWIVSLALKEDVMGNFCGGAIIGSKHILTAAHCFDSVSSSEAIVRSGITKLNDRTAIATGISRFIPHPEYKAKIEGSHSSNDIAILELDDDLPYGNRLSEIRLPKEEPREVTGFFAGWGLLKEEPFVMTPLLHAAKVEVISDRDCVAKGRPGRRPQYICVWLPGGTLLEGDSGGPLTYNGEIIGVASTGLGRIGVPSSFANVFHYVDWIKEILSSENEIH